ncbi:MAG: helix-turn-helix protein [Clostridia bacterium]|jgi:YesN/AraC family two-component response regulator|nr:helix-turn-helix protein [Clostridia bacterium]
MGLNGKIYKRWMNETISVKFLILITSILVFMALALIGYIYGGAKKNMVQKLVLNKQNQMDVQIEYTNNQLKQMELSAINWALRMKEDVADVLKTEENLTYDNTKTIRKDLASLEIGNLLVQEAFIYVDARVPYSIKTGETWREDNNQEDRFFFKNFNKNNEISWKRIDTDSGSKLIFSYRLSKQNDVIQKNLIIRINGQELDNVMGLRAYGIEEGLVLKDKHHYIFASSQNVTEHLTDMLRTIDQSARPVIKIRGKDYLYYKKDAELMSDVFTYIMFISLDKISGQVVDIFNYIVFWIAFCTLAAVLTAAWGIKKLFSPVQRLFQLVGISDTVRSTSDIDYVITKWEEIKSRESGLEQKIASSNQLLVENYFKQLLRNEQIEQSNIIKNKLIDLGWHLNNKRIILINFVLTDILGEDISVTKDEDLCYYMSENIIREKMLEVYKHTNPYLTAMTRSGILLMLLTDKEDTHAEREKLINLANNILKQINRFVGRHMVITISNEFEDYADISSIYKSIVEFRSARKVEEVNIILDMVQTPKNIAKNAYTYPVEFEKDIIQGIYLNDEEAVLKALSNFEQNIQSQKLLTEQMRATFLQLLNSLRYEVIQMGWVSEQVIKDIDNIFLELNTSEYIEQAKSLVWRNILKPLLDNRKENSVGQEKNYINKVLYFIRNHCQEEDFSLDWCAAQVNVDEFVLSRIFKKNMGINFIDYLTKTRLDKAMELLVTTNYPVTTVAQMVGYQSNYFSRLFKNKIGKTPGEYRKENQIQG